jgi:hypothetical protein
MNNEYTFDEFIDYVVDWFKGEFSKKELYQQLIDNDGMSQASMEEFTGLRPKQSVKLAKERLAELA